MCKEIIAGIVLTATVLFDSAGVVLASEEIWNDGVLFVEENLASVEGHTAVKIIFGLEPGKCTKQITAVSEWLIMREGIMTLKYPGEGEVDRAAGEEWYQHDGTKVVVCNNSTQKAVAEGVQFRPN